MSTGQVRVVAALGAGTLWWLAILVGGAGYVAVGGGDRLITQMMIHAIIVLGMQIYIGNTGVLSFGHIGFGAIAGYAFAATAISVERKAVTTSDMPFGLSEVELPPMLAAAIAVGVCLVVAWFIGTGLGRSGARSGAVAATVITLALLFLIHEVAVNWDDLTGGDRAGLSFRIGGGLQSRGPIVVALLAAILVARLFAISTTGRLAKAAREDVLAARAMGANPQHQQMVALLLSVAVVAVGAILRTYEFGSITPKFFFFDYTLLTLTMLIVGGRNSVSGALVGVVAITAGSELTRYLAGPDVGVAELVLRPGLTDIFLGGSMLGFMILRPRGLLDDWELDDHVFNRWRRRRETEVEPAGPTGDEGDGGPAGHLDAAGPGGATLVADGIVVDFGGFRALGGAGVEAASPEIVGIIGPNGAGKTTLLNVITGMVTASEGHIRVAGTDMTGAPAWAVARAGVVRTFQGVRLFSALPVRENVEVAALAARRYRRDRAGVATDVLLARGGLWDVRDRRASELDYGSARRLELVRAAAARPGLLLLDEPTSGMNDAESLAMVGQVRDMASLTGAGVVVIDHDLNFITGICDRIYCLDQGVVIAHGTPDQISADPHVQAAYLGVSS